MSPHLGGFWLFFFLLTAALSHSQTFERLFEVTPWTSIEQLTVPTHTMIVLTQNSHIFTMIFDFWSQQNRAGLVTRPVFSIRWPSLTSTWTPSSTKRSLTSWWPPKLGTPSSWWWPWGWLEQLGPAWQQPRQLLLLLRQLPTAEVGLQAGRALPPPGSHKRHPPRSRYCHKKAHSSGFLF